MSNMLRFQFRRLYRKPGSYIFLALVVIITLSTLSELYWEVGYYYLPNPYPSAGNALTLDWSIVYCFYSTDFLVNILIAIFIAIFVSEDKVKGTIKNIYSKGYPRTTIFFSKYLAAVSVPVIFYFLILFISFVYVSIRGSGYLAFSESSSNSVLVLLCTFFRYISITTFCYMLSELTPSTGGAIALNIFSPYILFSIFANIIYALKAPDFLENLVGDFLFSTTHLTLTAIPDSRVIELIISSIVFTLLYGGLSLLITVKKQIKN